MGDIEPALPLRGAVLAVVRIVVFVFSAIFASLTAAALNIAKGDSIAFRGWYYRVLRRLIGLDVVVRGKQSTAAPRLVVANHISYFDIVVLGSAIPGDFVAKADIANWPGFGWMAKAGQTIFIDRRRAATTQARDQIQERLDAGDTLIMFPEATSGDGNYMKPFKSALFTVAERHALGADGIERPVTVQPVSLAYTRLNGMPLGVGWRPFVAWYGDMEMASHMWDIMRLGRLTAEVTFHAPVTLAQFASRKELAAHCDRVTRAGFARLLAGREGA
jgi:1-acyl-sn-glycerol-3-phosphate acyltransferase